MDDLREILKVKYLMPAPQIDAFSQIGKMFRLEPGKHFIEAGAIPHKIGFVVSGLFRYVYISNKGVEYTKAIMPEHNFLSSYSAMISQTPSYYFIEALEESLVYEFSYLKWKELIESNPYWYRFLVKILEKGYSTKEKRERELLLLDAETRYRNFQKDFPGMENRVKQHIIASFLGIHPESLSRIRKKLLETDRHSFN